MTEDVNKKPETPLLDKIRLPEDVRNLSEEQLSQLADELRAETISAVSNKGRRNQ